MVKLYSTRRSPLKPTEKRNVVLLRFGSLVDFSQVRHTYGEISKQLGMKLSTVQMVVQRLRRDGPNALEERWYRRTPWPVGNRIVESLLLSEPILRKWGCLSLAERAAKIRVRFNVEVEPHRLGKFYRRHNVTYRKSYFSYRAEV